MNHAAVFAFYGLRYLVVWDPVVVDLVVGGGVHLVGRVGQDGGPVTHVRSL